MTKASAISMVFLFAVWACTPLQERRETNYSDAEKAASEPGDVLRFSLTEGRIRNEFYRDDAVAAHLVMTSGLDPRLIVAFPAGNTGFGFFFDATAEPVTWRGADAMRSVNVTDEQGRPLYGIEAELTLDAAEITIDRAVLGSIRVIRNYQNNGELPSWLDAVATAREQEIIWTRERLDGRGEYSVAVKALSGTTVSLDRQQVRFAAIDGQAIRLSIVASPGEEPLTPIAIDRLVGSGASADLRSKQVLAFLSYEEKLLAGSWRFLTYFGRDTLLTLKLLMPVAQPELVEAGLGSVLERVNSAGEVAHEEDIGEYPAVRQRRAGEPRHEGPVYDYAMIDDDYMLAPIAAEYFLDRDDGAARAPQFLERKTSGGRRFGDVLVRNLEYVLQTTEAFASRAVTENLIRLKDGYPAGDWRDSREGLGGGRIPYNVNAVLAPAALRAVARLADSGILDPYRSPRGDRFQSAGARAAAWSSAAPLFRVRIGNEAALNAMSAYADNAGVAADAARKAIGNTDMAYSALALDDAGDPIPVIHSDYGFLLAFSDPPRTALSEAIAAAMRPFPAGLLTPIGLLVANPAFSGDETLWAQFDRGRYHGTVVWSWQHALFIAGLNRQLQREDLDEDLRAKLEHARRTLREVVGASADMRTSELWSWAIDDGRYIAVPFGQSDGDESESNAAQLWSTVYLGVK